MHKMQRILAIMLVAVFVVSLTAVADSSVSASDVLDSMNENVEQEAGSEKKSELREEIESKEETNPEEGTRPEGETNSVEETRPEGESTPVEPEIESESETVSEPAPEERRELLAESVAAASQGAARTLADVLSMDYGKYITWLKSHENDSYYLTTPYMPSAWRSPNGAINQYGYASDGVSAGMNCTGFIWHALYMATLQSGVRSFLIRSI